MYVTQRAVCYDSYSELWGCSWSGGCSASASGVCGSGHNPDCLLHVVSVVFIGYQYNIYVLQVLAQNFNLAYL